MQDLLEKNLTSVVAYQQAMIGKQKEMDERMKYMDVIQDIMDANLRSILELLKKP